MSHDHCLIAGCHAIARFNVRAYVDMDGAKSGIGRSARSLRVCSEHVEVALTDCAMRAVEDVRAQGYIHSG